MSYNKIFFSLVCSLLFLSLSACEFESAQILATQDLESSGDGVILDEIIDPEDPEDDRIAPEICSALDFTGVTWPTSYSSMDEMAFSLAINITGSFEGHAGWTNLSNNFDGQGVSMGILNQNLGQGTLQPLLIRMRDNHRDVLERVMSPSMLDSLLGMLSRWESSNTTVLGKLSVAPVPAPAEKFLVSSHDGGNDKTYGSLSFKTQSTQQSVDWAVANLYVNSNGTDFKPEWRSALKEIAGDPSYVSLQIEAAQYIYNRAHTYYERVGWVEMRSYLFLFDIVTQNGSLSERHFVAYQDWLDRNPEATEEEMLLQMLEIRVVDVNPRWQEDVRRRKTTIIQGEGFVHGANRNLPEEYCFDPQIPY